MEGPAASVEEDFDLGSEVKGVGVPSLFTPDPADAPPIAGEEQALVVSPKVAGVVPAEGNS